MIVVAVLVVLALVAIGAWVVIRREGDEVHSVEGYRHTLDTLQGIRTKSTSASVRVLGGPPATGGVPGSPGDGVAGADDDAGPEAANGVNGDAAGTLGHRVGPRGELVFEDPALSETGNRSGVFGGRRDRAMTAMNHRPRRLGAPIMVGVVVLAVLALIILAGVHNKGPHKAAGATSTTATTAGSHTTSAAAGGHATTPTTTATGKAKGHHSPTPVAPVTTVPANFTAQTSTATTATYKPPAATYTLTLSTTNGECWVDVTSGGTTLFTKTMLAGQQQSVSASGTTTVVLGAPGAIGLQLDHLPVVLPAGYQTPFTLTLAP